MQFALKNVTPALAKKWLEDTEAAGFCNRPTSAATIARYANMMSHPELWHGAETAETIKFAVMDGKKIVIDGRHRLSAVIIADTPVKLWTVDPVPLDMFKYFDQGKSRDVADMMAVAKWPDPKHLASAGRMLWKEDTTGSPFKKPDAEDSLGEGPIYDHINEVYNGDLKETFTRYSRTMKDAQRLGRGGVGWLLYVAMRCKEVEREKLESVLDYLGDLTAAPPHASFAFAIENVRKAREGMQREGNGRVLMGRNRDLCDITVTSYNVAWNAWRSGRRIGTLRTFQNAANEATHSWSRFA